MVNSDESRHILRYSIQIRLFLAGLMLLLSISAMAEMDAEVRPKVGLALSGGGSRGAAHIGVLRELERQRIPIDFIAGTSVGSIIGGLYAAGMSVDEIEEVVVHSNLSDIFKDEQSRHDMAPRRKFDQLRLLALSAAQYQIYLDSRHPLNEDALVIDSIGIENDSRLADAFVVRSGVQQDLGHMLSLSTYAGASLQYGNVFQTRDSLTLDAGILATSAWLGWKTILGLVFLGYGYAKTGDSSIYLEIGSHF